MLVVLAALALLLGIVDPQPPSRWLHWLDVPTLAGLLALLAVAQGVRESGLVQRLARRLLGLVRGQRGLALLLLALSALLAMLLTNDVSLFLLMPLTLALTEQAHLPRLRLVVLQALAVNAGSALSPVGNPQNLMLWRRAGIGMPEFVWAMAPTVAVLALVLLIFTCVLVPAAPLRRRAMPPQRTPLDARLGVVAAALFPLVLVLLEFRHAATAAVLALLVLGAVRPRVLAHLDWLLLATIALMLVGLGHLAELPRVQALLASLDWRQPGTAYLGGALLSQLVSNVPATVALLHTPADPQVLAMAVNVAGSGLAIGSLASLIALRLEGSREIWRSFHAIAVPYFLLTAVLVWWLLPHVS